MTSRAEFEYRRFLALSDNTHSRSHKYFLVGFSKYQGSCRQDVDTVVSTVANICGFILVPSLMFSLVPYFPNP